MVMKGHCENYVTYKFQSHSVIYNLEFLSYVLRMIFGIYMLQYSIKLLLEEKDQITSFQPYTTCVCVTFSGPLDQICR